MGFDAALVEQVQAERLYSTGGKHQQQHADSQTDRQTVRQTDRQTNRQTDRQQQSVRKLNPKHADVSFLFSRHVGSFHLLRYVRLG
jgi:hypothetical protein